MKENLKVMGGIFVVILILLVAITLLAWIWGAEGQMLLTLGKAILTDVVIIGVILIFDMILGESNKENPRF